MTKLLCGVALGLLLNLGTTALGDQDEDYAAGLCLKENMDKKNLGHKVAECVDVKGDDMAKCFGLPEVDFIAVVEDCVQKVTEDKCVAEKAKVDFKKYADCRYGKDPKECYKKLGLSTDDTFKLAIDCANKGAQ